MKKIIISSIVCAVPLFFMSCGSDAPSGAAGSQSAEEKMQDELLDEAMSEGADQEMESFYLPSALQIGSIFQKSGLQFVTGLTNPVENKQNYVSRTSKILNFGVYSADLAYIVLNSQNQDAMNYLTTVSELSDEIGFGSVFESKDLMDRFQANLGNHDSIINVMIDIQARTDMFVDDHNLQDITYTIFAGAWVEGMYLGVKASDQKNKHQISGRLVEQMTILDNLRKALRSNKNQTEEIRSITKDLGELEKFFMRLEENKNAQNIASFRDYKISDEHMAELSEMIVNLRMKIING